MVYVKERKIFSISLVKNEEDIIESFVRYHQHILDGMVILDHGSTDHTLTILEKLKSEGIPLFLGYDNSPDYLQQEIMTSQLYDTFKQFNPDIVIPLDADEFLVSANHLDHPRKIMNEMDLNKVHYLRFRNYYPDTKDNQEELFIPKRIIHYFDGGFCKVLVTKENMNDLPFLSMGNHDLPNYYGKPINMEVSTVLELAHFPIRSIEQLKSKAVVGWISNLTRYNRYEGECSHWEKWFNMIKQNPNITLHEILGHTTLQPKPINLSFCHSIDIKYTEANGVSFIKNLLAYGEVLAKGYSELRRNRGSVENIYGQLPIEINKLVWEVIDNPIELIGWIDDAKVEGSDIITNGWAKNPITGEPPKEVIIVNEDRKIIAYTRVDQLRNDVAAYFHDQRMLQSGWSVTFNKNLLSAGSSTFFAYIFLRNEKKAIRINRSISLVI